MTKVSRERVYKECDGFLTGEGRPQMGFLLLFNLDLLKAVLPVASYINNVNNLQQHENDVMEWEKFTGRILYWINVLLTILNKANKSNTLSSKGLLSKLYDTFSKESVFMINVEEQLNESNIKVCDYYKVNVLLNYHIFISSNVV